MSLGVDTCSTCEGPLRPVSSTLAICPACAAKPVAPIPYGGDWRPRAPRPGKDRR